MPFRFTKKNASKFGRKGAKAANRNRAERSGYAGGKRPRKRSLRRAYDEGASRSIFD